MTRTSSWKLYLSVVCCILVGGLHSIDGCGGRYTGSSGSIMSPNYPGNYNRNLSCVYIIDAGETLITLVFEDFYTWWSDVVKVFDASNNLLVRLQGGRQGYIVQSAVYYSVVFTTDGSYVKKGFKATWNETTTEHARVGGYATLSWTLPEPGTRELSVCNTETKKCLLHVTGYNDIRAASDKWTSRVRFIGNVSSSGTGLFRFTLSSVTWEDAGLYQCYRGAPDSRGPIIPNCGQKLLLPDDAVIGETVTLSCRLPQPVVREFTVWNTDWNIPLAHVTNYQDVNIVSEVYRSRLTLKFHGHDRLILELKYVGLNDEGQFCCYSGTPDSRGSRITDCGQRLRVYSALTVFARHGYTATLSWRLPQPGVREFTVRRNLWGRSATLFHVTNYTKVNITSAYRTRAVFTGNINSSGSGVFSFLLNDDVWKSDGLYRCYRGSPGTTDQISNCFQELYVIYIQDPYIVASETIPPGSSAMLTCSSFTRSYYYYYIPDVYFTWRKNGDQLETGARLHLTEDNERFSLYHYRYFSTLTISAVRKEGDHYTCQGGMNQMWMTNWSDEYTLSRTWAESYTNYTVVQEGDNSTVTWKMPLSGDPFSVKTPEGGYLLFVNYTDIYVEESYWLRVKISGIIKSSSALVVRFTLYNATAADAGKYYCNRETSCEHVLVVSQGPYIVAPNTFGESGRATLTCYTYCKGSENMTLALTGNWRRNNTELQTGGRYAVSVPVQRDGDGFWTSTLDITAVEKTDTGDRYSCQLIGKKGLKTDWSQEYVVGVNALVEANTNDTVTREGDNAMVFWKIPNLTYKFEVRSPTGVPLFSMETAKVYLQLNYISRVTITVITSTDAVVLWLQFYNVTIADAGRYSCWRTSDDSIIPGCTHLLVVSRFPGITKTNNNYQDDIMYIMIGAGVGVVILIMIIACVCVARKRRKGKVTNDVSLTEIHSPDYNSLAHDDNTDHCYSEIKTIAARQSSTDVSLTEIHSSDYDSMAHDDNTDHCYSEIKTIAARQSSTGSS